MEVSSLPFGTTSIIFRVIIAYDGPIFSKYFVNNILQFLQTISSNFRNTIYYDYTIKTISFFGFGG